MFNQSINLYGAIEARDTVRLCRIKEKCLKTDLKYVVNACVPRQRRRSSSRRHAFLPPVTALSPWLRRGHGTACRDLSHRYLHWRPLDVSLRRNCSSEVFLISTSDRYSVLTLRRTRVLPLSLAFVRCPCSFLTLLHINLFFL